MSFSFQPLLNFLFGFLFEQVVQYFHFSLEIVFPQLEHKLQSFPVGVFLNLGENIGVKADIAESGRGFFEDKMNNA